MTKMTMITMTIKDDDDDETWQVLFQVGQDHLGLAFLMRQLKLAHIDITIIMIVMSICCYSSSLTEIVNLVHNKSSDQPSNNGKTKGDQDCQELAECLVFVLVIMMKVASMTMILTLGFL